MLTLFEDSLRHCKLARRLGESMCGFSTLRIEDFLSFGPIDKGMEGLTRRLGVGSRQ